MAFPSATSLAFDALRKNKPIFDLYNAYKETQGSATPATAGLAKFLGIVDSQNEEEDEVTKSYMDLEQNQAQIDANLEAEGFESNPQRESRLAKEKRQKELDSLDNLEQRQMLRGRITEAFGRGLSSEDRDKELIALEMEGSQLGIDPKAMQREIKEEQGIFDKEAARKKSYDAFFARANDPNRTLGVGQRRRLYSPRARLKLAKRLRKEGFTKAAERAAMQYADSPEAMAPSISTPQMRQQQQLDSQRAGEVREMNRGLTQLLLAKTQRQLRDPEFKLFG